MVGLIDRRPTVNGSRRRAKSNRRWAEDEASTSGRRKPKDRYGARNASTGTSVVPETCSGQGIWRFQSIRLYSRQWQGRSGAAPLAGLYEIIGLIRAP